LAVHTRSLADILLRPNRKAIKDKYMHRNEQSHRDKDKERKGRVFIQRLYTAFSLKALRHGSHSFTCKLHHACLSTRNAGEA